MASFHTLKTKYKNVANYTTYFVLTLVTIEKDPFRFTSFSILFHFVNFARKKQKPNQIKSNQKGLLWTEVSRDLGVGTGEHPSKASKRPRAGFLRCNDCCHAFIAAAAVPTHVRPSFLPSVPSLALLSQPHT
jgi:hypothetical protein